MNREILRKLQFPLMLALLIYPISGLILGYADLGLLKWRWAFPAMVMVFSCTAMPIPGKIRLPFGAACSVLLVLLSAYLMNLGADWKVWLLGAGSAAILMWSLKIGTWKPEQEIPAFWIIAGMVSQLGVRVAMVVMENTQGKTLPQIQWEINLAFFILVILAMVSMNRSVLTRAAMGRTGASRSMRRKNTLMILAVAVIALLISLLPVFVAAAGWIMDKVRQAIRWYSSLFGKVLVEEPQQEQFAPPGEQEQYSPFALFSVKVLIFAVIAFIVVQFFLVLKAFIKGIIDRMGKFTSDASEDYVDEVTDIREEEDHQVRTRKLRRSEERELDGLSPVQQVRRQYRRLLRTHEGWGDARTARENIPQDMARIYEQARYSGASITEEEAKSFRSGTKKL